MDDNERALNGHEIIQSMILLGKSKNKVLEGQVVESSEWWRRLVSLNLMLRLLR